MPTRNTEETNEGAESSDAPKENNCFECREGCVMGERVYCSIDGRFHPPYDNFPCKSFVPKILKIHKEALMDERPKPI